MKTVYQTCKMNKVFELNEDREQILVFENGRFKMVFPDLNTAKNYIDIKNLVTKHEVNLLIK